MTAENSDILRPGAVILSVERKASWLKITTNIGTIHVAGAREAMELECPRCLEQRLIEIVQTAKVRKGVCLVCSKAWALPAPTAAVSSPVPDPRAGEAP